VTSARASIYEAPLGLPARDVGVGDVWVIDDSDDSRLYKRMIGMLFVVPWSYCFCWFVVGSATDKVARSNGYLSFEVLVSLNADNSTMLVENVGGMCGTGVYNVDRNT